jgi:hypothetical protein
VLLPVLKSISKMLDKSLLETDVASARVYVSCAVDLLNSTIDEMQDKDVPMIPAPFVQAKPVMEYVIDAPSGILKSIRSKDGVHIPMDTMVVLDGVAMEYRSAIGKSFKTGNVV